MRWPERKKIGVCVCQLGHAEVRGPRPATEALMSWELPVAYPSPPAGLGLCVPEGDPSCYLFLMLSLC